MNRAVIVCASVESLGDVLFVGATGEKQHRLFDVFDLADVFEHFNARHAGDAPIKDKEIHSVSINRFDHVCAIVEDGHRVARALQNFAHVLGRWGSSSSKTMCLVIILES